MAKLYHSDWKPSMRVDFKVKAYVFDSLVQYNNLMTAQLCSDFLIVKKTRDSPASLRGKNAFGFQFKSLLSQV